MGFKDFWSDESSKVLNKESLTKFIDYVSDFLELKDIPKISFVDKLLKKGDQPTFGSYDSDADLIVISSLNRHPMDILRTLTHELVHFKQKSEGENLSGKTGSDTENEANATAGVILRNFGKKFPKYYECETIHPDLMIDK